MNVKINEESNVTQQQIVGFSDQNQQWTYSIDNRLDDVHRTTDSDDATLSNFFSRPIKIATINWTVGATFGTTINPWQQYFENLRVINRITNYHLLRCKLCVRIMINGNGFHYGRALASYRPLHQVDDFTPWRYGLVPEDTIGASQRMHVWIDPTKSQGGTLCLPYVYYKNAMNIPDMEWREQGELDIASVTTLEHANGGADAVTISVFAWAEDVSLSIPTIAEPGALAPQSGFDDVSEQAGDEHDEKSGGPISGPAAVVASVAGALATVPQIRPFALATSMAAGAVGNIAKMFGMSRPVDTGPISSYKPTYVGNMPNSNTLDTSTKLTYDVKQELTIDPVATGLGPADEMALVSIASRESYLTQFPWSTSDVPETMLWNCFVEPNMMDAAFAGTELHHTPMAYASLPFRHWRGSINYRFQIVASSFHKGRIKVVYEPYLAVGGATEYNTQLTHVIDLAKERDFTVTINWGQEFSYLQVSENISAPFSTSPLGSTKHGQANGLLYVSVVNDLTTPSAVLSDVSILVSVSAGDDFQVINPVENLENFGLLQPQGGGTYEYWNRLNDYCEDCCVFDEQADLDNADNDLTLEESAPIQQGTETDLATKLSTSDNTDKIYFGDPVSSVRQLLKRYEFCVSHVADGNNVETSTRIVMPDFPLYRGYAGITGSIHNAATPVDPTPYNFVETTMMNYFTPCFLARRGGIRYKYVYANNDDNVVQGIMSAARSPVANSYSRGALATSNSLGSTSQQVVAVNNRALESHAGMTATQVSQNPVLEIEIPFHTNYRYIPARKRHVINVQDDFEHYHIVQFPNSTLVGSSAVTSYVASGEDFSLSFFQACPILYFTLSPAPSTTA